MTDHEQSDRGFSPSGREPGGRAAVVLVLTIALICGAVAAGWLWSAGGWADRALVEHLHRVTATTTGPARELPDPAGHGVQPRAVAPAVWKYPEHVRRSGTVQVPPRTPRGRTVPIWVDATGAPVRPPDRGTERMLASLTAGTAAAGVVGAAGAGALVLVRRRTEGRALAALEREWEEVEPVWSGRLRWGSGSGTDEE
ncbi:Rv1733c family protein [Streptomyces sp. NPDC001732]